MRGKEKKKRKERGRKGEENKKIKGKQKKRGLKERGERGGSEPERRGVGVRDREREGMLGGVATSRGQERYAYILMLLCRVR